MMVLLSLSFPSLRQQGGGLGGGVGWGDKKDPGLLTLITPVQLIEVRVVGPVHPLVSILWPEPTSHSANITNIIIYVHMNEK